MCRKRSTLLIAFASGTLLGLGAVVSSWSDLSGEARADLAIEDFGSLPHRLTEIEKALALERYERQMLADEFAGLRDALAALPVSGAGSDDWLRSDPPRRLALAPAADARNAPATDSVLGLFPDSMRRTPEALDRFLRQQQFDRFVAAGITPSRVQLIMEREQEVELEVLRRRFAATQSGATPPEVASITPLALLRSELGDTDYAKYLNARGRPTSIGVSQVFKNSPAEFAGLMPGDEIVAYNGQRAFSIEELTALSYESAPATMVPLEVIRDGQTIRLYIAGGPIGISEGGGL